MTIIELPNGENAEFPDSMSQEDIKSVLQKKFPPAESKSEMVDTFLGELPRRPKMEKKDIEDLINTAALGTGGIGSKPLSITQNVLGKPILEHLGRLGINQISPRISSLINSLETPLSGAMIGGAVTPENPLVGAITAAGLSVIPGLAGSVANKLKPSNLFRGTLSPEELQNALNVTKGTETPLGDVIQSPFLKRQYENVFSKIPFSGVTESMQRTGNLLIDRGNSILNKLAGGHPTEDVGGVIQDALHQSFKETLKEKQNVYNDFNKMASKFPIQLKLRRFSNLAQKYADAIEDSKFLKYEPEESALFRKLVNYKEPVTTKTKEGLIVNKEGQPLTKEISTKYPTVKEANLLKGKLNHYAELASSSPDPGQRRLAGVFSTLAKALKEDLLQSMSAVDKEHKSNLVPAYKKAEDQYSQKFSKFLDKEMYKYATNKADSDLLLQAFLKTSKNTDRANLLNKLTSKLPADKKNLLGYHLFSSAVKDGKLDPNRFVTIYNNLGPRQKEILFPEKGLRKEIENYVHLVKKNPEALKTMFNPPTGQRLGEIFPIGAALTGFHYGGIPGALIGGASLPLIGRGFNKLMTSPKVREKLINKMLERK